MLRLDEKLQNIREGRYKRSDFIIADAKDFDAGAGITCSGFDYTDPSGQARRRTRDEFLDQIEAIVKQDIVDIMLVSVSNLERLHERAVFEASQVKPAIRANLTTDCWGGIRHGQLLQGSFKAVPVGDDLARDHWDATTCAWKADHRHRSRTLLDHLRQRPGTRCKGARRVQALSLIEAAANNFRYFYEVFNPNIDIGLQSYRDRRVPQRHNPTVTRWPDQVRKTRVPQRFHSTARGHLRSWPASHSELIVGVLGGGAGTTRDTFELVNQAERYGARLGLVRSQDQSC